MKKIEDMSMQHQFTWNTLKMMKDGERILGPQLQERAGVNDQRAMYQIINELRKNGYLIGGDKAGKRGYYQLRTPIDVKRAVHTLIEPALDLIETAEFTEEHFYSKEYQDLLRNQEESEDE